MEPTPNLGSQCSVWSVEEVCSLVTLTLQQGSALLVNTRLGFDVCGRQQTDLQEEKIAVKKPTKPCVWPHLQASPMLTKPLLNSGFGFLSLCGDRHQDLCQFKLCVETHKMDSEGCGDFGAAPPTSAKGAYWNTQILDLLVLLLSFILLQWWSRPY